MITQNDENFEILRKYGFIQKTKYTENYKPYPKFVKEFWCSKKRFPRYDITIFRAHGSESYRFSYQIGWGDFHSGTNNPLTTYQQALNTLNQQIANENEMGEKKIERVAKMYKDTLEAKE